MSDKIPSGDNNQDENPGRNPLRDELLKKGAVSLGSSNAKFHYKHKNSHAREIALQALYQIEVVNKPVHETIRFHWLQHAMGASEHEFCKGLVLGVTDNWEALDRVIMSLSHKDFSQVSSIIRSILRLGIYELMRADLDSRIIMDDLLNLTRTYDGEESVAFVNGVLDRFEKERVKKLSK